MASTPKGEVTILAGELGSSHDGKGKYSYHVLREALPTLQEEGWSVRILAPSDAQPPPLPSDASIVRLPAPKSMGIGRVLSEHLYTPLSATSDVFVSLNAAIPLLPIPAERRVTVFHDLYPVQHWENPDAHPLDPAPTTLRFHVLSMRWALRHSTHFLSVSRATREAVHQHAPKPKPSALAPCGVDRDRFRPDLPRKRIREVRDAYDLPETFHLFVGSPTSTKKNFRLVRELYDRTGTSQDTFPPVLVAGSGSRMRLGERPGSPIRGLGYVPAEDLPVLYGEARSLLQPSFHEGFGLPALEAMACGTPPIVADRAAMPEVVGDGGLTVDPTSTTDLRAALSTLDNQEERERVGQRAVERARDYTWEQPANRLVESIDPTIELSEAAEQGGIV